MARLESLDPRIEELWNVSFGLTTEKGRSCRFNVAQESNPLIHLFFFHGVRSRLYLPSGCMSFPLDEQTHQYHPICFVILDGWLRAEEYFGEMPWLALDFSDRKLKEPGMDGGCRLPTFFSWEDQAASVWTVLLQEQLSSAFKVQGIPSLATELQGCEEAQAWLTSY